MRLAPTKRSLAATVLLIVVVFAALSILCADGVHVLISGGIASDCGVMTHTRAFGAAAGPGLSVLVVSMLIAFVGLSGVPTPKSRLHADSHVAFSYGRPADPLHGRLRL
jgi:hypothetical protein